MADIPYTGTKWRGIGNPLRKGNSGYFTSKFTKDLVVSSIYHILTTHLGTRLMRPSFGSVFPELIFEQNDKVLKAELEVYVRSAIMRWEPRVSSIKVQTAPSQDRVNVTVSYTIKETGQRVDNQLQFERNNVSSIKMVV